MTDVGKIQVHSKGTDGTVLTLISAASNTNGCYIKTLNVQNISGNPSRVYIAPTAPSSDSDNTKKVMVGVYRNTETVKDIVIPTGQGLYFTPGGADDNNACNLTYDNLAVEVVLPLSTGSSAAIIFDPMLLPNVDGDLIASWVDKNAVCTLTSSGASRPTYKTATNGRDFIRFSGTNKLDTGAAGINLDDASFAFTVVMDRTQFSGATNAAAVIMAFNGTRYHYYDTTAHRVNDGTLKGGPGGELNTGNLDILTVWGNVSNVNFMQNGVAILSSAPLAGGDITQMALGRSLLDTLGLVGDMYYCELYTAAFADQAAAKANDQRIRDLIKYKDHKPGVPFVLAISNSLFEGKGNTIRANRPLELSYAQTGIDPILHDYIVRAYGGAKTGDFSLSTVRDKMTVPHLIGAGAGQWVLIWEFTNSIVAGRTAAQTYSDLLAYVTYLKNNWPEVKIAVSTCIPRKSSSIDTVRLATNALLMASTTSFSGLTYIKNKGGVDGIDVVLDPCALTVFDAEVDADNTTYYNGDKTHLTDAGSLAFANGPGKDFINYIYNPTLYP